MKIILFFGVVVVFCMAFCPKKIRNNEEIPANCWRYDTLTFFTFSSSWSTIDDWSHLTFSPDRQGSDSPAINFIFLKRPRANGTYKIRVATFRNDEVSIVINERHSRTGRNPGRYIVSDNDRATAKVKLIKGKLSIYCDSVIIMPVDNYNMDSSILSFNLTEF